MNSVEGLEKVMTEIEKDMHHFFSLRENSEDAKRLPEAFRKHERWKNEPELLSIVEGFANLPSMGELLACQERIITANLFLRMFEFKEILLIGRESPLSPEAEKIAKLFFKYTSLFSEWLVKIPHSEQRYLETCTNEEQRQMVLDLLKIVKEAASRYGTFKAEAIN